MSGPEATPEPSSDAPEPSGEAEPPVAGVLRRPRPVILVVVDGFGVGPDPSADAIVAAGMPRWRAFHDAWPHTVLDASGPAVGLPEGQMGNSEVGHLNIGAGRPVLQDLPRIDAAIADGSLATNPALVEAMTLARERGTRLHLISLIGPGGVHANDRHLVAVAALARASGVDDVVVHALLDGRDTPPRSAVGFLADLEGRLAAAHPRARIATIGGRYHAMDRDRRWERVATGYAAIAHGEAAHDAPAAEVALADAYARGENDEFVAPTLVAGGAPIRDGDVVIHCNFRADRARELTHALVDATFDGFDRGERPSGVHVVTMTEYEEGLPVVVAFPPEVVTSLAEIVSQQGWRQFHVAETEKYAHVTYFLNGGVETAWPGEERQLVPSPKVATYDLEPAMSAVAVADAIVAAITGGDFDVVMANFANPDMVGHTGVWDAAVAACRVLDDCLGRVIEAFEVADRTSVEAGGAGALLVVTADHGNADVMRDAAGSPVTAHSLSPVPLVVAGEAARGLRLRPGVLSDVTPTILGLLGLSLAPGMSGESLVVGEG
ncbi:MAG: 2,3-bisphosphoglycerate-independent phosphoglycerate mutase [Chloroflexi bacterium]|nr:2,3-bisphosphoglycerate-independent phosphoglycerate mutase [Chloroflexota bacterium]